MRTWKSLSTRFVGDRSAATSIEYALIAGLIAIVIVGAVTTVGKNVRTPFNAVAQNLI